MPLVPHTEIGGVQPRPDAQSAHIFRRPAGILACAFDMIMNKQSLVKFGFDLADLEAGMLYQIDVRE